VSTQAQEPPKRAWWTEEDETLGPVARVVDWVRWHRLLTVVIILALAAIAAGIVNLATGGQSGNAAACTNYYNAQNFAGDGDTTDAGTSIQAVFNAATRITSPALSRAVYNFRASYEEETANPNRFYQNAAVANACVSLGLGNSASN
jgi:hypothetical protein